MRLLGRHARRVSTVDRASAASTDRYWALTGPDLVARLETAATGLSSSAAAARLRRHGPNTLMALDDRSRLSVLLRQLASPLLLLLVFAAAASAFSGEWLDAAMVVTIVVATVAIGYSREYSAAAATRALRERVRVHATVLRDGLPTPTPVEAIVPGDVVLLAAGSLAPADAVILEATDCFVSEAVLTGESFPVEKTAGVVAPDAPLAARSNCVFLGTNVRSGTARCLVIRTGEATEFGSIAGRLKLRPPETEFDRGIRRFGYLLTGAMLMMTLVVFVAHVLRGRPPIDTLLFAIALAVGLSPELLPAILSVNLARGAQMMAGQGVLVRRLNAIENLGSADILCTDKTGTLTEGVVRVEGAYGEDGQPSAGVLELAAINAALETGVASPLDDAILNAHSPAPGSLRKVAEIPFDFLRKRVSVVVEDPAAGALLITKGAFRQVLDVCSHDAAGAALTAERRLQLTVQHERWSRAGLRVLAIATVPLPMAAIQGRSDERDMSFAGFVTFLDAPRNDAATTRRQLAELGVAVKLVTGDNVLVATHVAALVGMHVERVLTGRDLDELTDEALWHVAERVDGFAEVDPNQKERIILSLKKMGHVVAFLGDGVNDAPAMHAADTSLAVASAVDVAREAADFVLLDRSLDVIRRGIEAGRVTFANTLKYILITTSANLGNMVSMAGISLFLPFLPLTAGQILLNNFLSDVPAVGLADDRVDGELVDRPRRWDIGFIARYMLQFGLLSSVFDLLLFALLLVTFHSDRATFQTAWFMESLLTELVICLVVRTRRPFFRSRPGRLLLLSTLGVAALAFAIPYLPYASAFGFVRLPAPLVSSVVGITAAYVAATEFQKRRFYARRGV